MNRRNVFFMGLAILFCLSATAYAQEPALEFYNRPMSEDLNGNMSLLSNIENEIREQGQAVLKLNGINDVVALNYSNLTGAVKVVLAEGKYASEVLEQLGSANDVAIRKVYVNTEDIFASRFLKYSWKVPVMETEDYYMYATVKINSIEDISVSSTIAPKKEMSDVCYIFDKELVPSILRSSGLNVDYDIVFPVYLPSISTDIVIFSANEVQYAIPFSARPELLDVENGKIYEYNEIEIKINALLEELLSADTIPMEPVGGGVGQVDVDAETFSGREGILSYFLPIGLVVVLVCAGGLLIYNKKRVG